MKATVLSVTFLTNGGIGIGGSVVSRLGNFFARSSFRSRFEKKGRFSNFTAQIPTFVITAQQPAFIGAAALLNQHLQKNQQVAPRKEAQREMQQETLQEETLVATHSLPDAVGVQAIQQT